MLAELGIAPERVRLVVVSHADVDHFGGVQDARESFPNAEIVAGAGDRPMIERYDRYESERARGFLDVYGLDEDPAVLEWCRSVTREGALDRDAIDGEVVDLGGIEAVIRHVPGHSHGHVAVEVPSADAMLVADAVLGASVNLADGTPAFPPTYRYVDEYLATIAGLRQRDPAILLTAHYPAMDRDAARAFLAESRAFVERLDELIMDALQRAPDGLTLAELLGRHQRRRGRVAGRRHGGRARVPGGRSPRAARRRRPPAARGRARRHPGLEARVSDVAWGTETYIAEDDANDALRNTRRAGERPVPHDDGPELARQVADALLHLQYKTRNFGDSVAFEALDRRIRRGSATNAGRGSPTAGDAPGRHGRSSPVRLDCTAPGRALAGTSPSATAIGSCSPPCASSPSIHWSGPRTTASSRPGTLRRSRPRTARCRSASTSRCSWTTRFGWGLRRLACTSILPCSWSPSAGHWAMIGT